MSDPASPGNNILIPGIPGNRKGILTRPAIKEEHTFLPFLKISRLRGPFPVNIAYWVITGPLLVLYIQ